MQKKDYNIFYAAFIEKDEGITSQYVCFCSLIIMIDISTICRDADKKKGGFIEPDGFNGGDNAKLFTRRSK